MFTLMYFTIQCMYAKEMVNNSIAGFNFIEKCMILCYLSTELLKIADKMTPFLTP